MPDKLTLDQFGAKVKEKYPEYKDVNNEELAQKMLDKYPEYKESVELKKKVSTKDSPVSGNQNLPLKSVGREGTSKSPSKTGKLKNMSGEEFQYEDTPVETFTEEPKIQAEKHENKLRQKIYEKPRTVAEFNQDFGIKPEENDYQYQDKVLKPEHQEELLDKIDFKRYVAAKQNEFLNPIEDNYLWAWTKGTNEATIKLLNTLDGAGRLVNKILPGGNPFMLQEESIAEKAANYLKEGIKSVETKYRTPNTILGSIAEGAGYMGIDAPLMMLAPETKLGYMSISGIKSVPGIATYLGTTNALNTFQDLDKKNTKTIDKITETGKAFAGGFTEGLIMHGLGYVSSKTGSLVKGLTDSDALDKIATIGTGAVSFGGLTAADQYVSGKINTKEIAAQTILGGALTAMGVGKPKESIKAELEARQEKAVNSFFTTKTEDIESIHKIPQTVEQLREKQLALEKQIEKETDPEAKEQMQIASKVLDNFIDVKFATKQLITDPAAVIDRIQKDETLSDVEKKHYTDKINEVVAKTDPRIQATKSLTAEIEKTDANIEAIKNNESLSDLQKNHIIEGLENKKKDLSKSINEEMSKPIDMIELDKYEQLKSKEYEKQNEGSVGQEGNLQAIRTEEKGRGEEKSSPEHEAKEVNGDAESIRKDEGKVQEGGAEPKIGKDESGQNIQRQEEAGTKIRDEKDEVISEFVPEGMGEPEPAGTKSVPIKDLKTEPEFFQYKPESDAKGKTKGVKPELPTEENPVTVWKEGDVVIEGHNKLNRAKEEGIEDIPVKYISAKTKEEALAKAAFENVKKGELSGLTKTDKGYKIDKNGIEFDGEGNIISKEPIGDKDQKTTGISHEALSKTHENIGQETPDRGKGVTVEEAIKLGQKLLKQGIDPQKIADDFKKDGKISGESVSVVRAHHEKLINEVNKIGEKYGKNSKEYKEASKKALDWAKNIVKPMATEWHKIGQTFQGETEVDTGTFVGLQRHFQELTGKDFNDKQALKAEKLSNNVKKLTEDYEKTIKELTDKIDDLIKKSPETKKTIKENAKRIANVIRQGKLSKPDVFSAASPASLVWDGAIEVAAKTIETGGTIAQAIADGLSHIKNSDWYKSFDKKEEAEKSFEDYINSQKNVDLSTRFVDKKGNKFTPDEVKDIWDYAKKEYLDKDVPYRDMISGVSKDLGLSPEQLRRAISQPKGVKTITDELYKKQYKRIQAINAAKEWVKSADTPKLIKFFKSVPSIFFGLKVFGHGTVGMITHAGLNIVKPSSWNTYWPNFFKQFKFAFGSTSGYEQAMENLQMHPDFTFWKRAGLSVDPSKVYDDYQAFSKYFPKFVKRMSESGDRGFNALKTYRLDLAKSIFDGLSDVERSDPNTAKEIAQIVNHSTGSVKANIPKIFNVAFFAPRLELSRWERLIVEPVKAIKTFSNWNNSEPSQKAAAKIVAKRAGEMLATYSTLLAANAALNNYLGSKDKTNFTDPTKSDWMKFKIGGETIDFTGGILSTMTFVSRLIEESVQSQKNMKGMDKNRLSRMEKVTGNYVRGKFSPFLSTVTDFATQADFMGKPLPFSSDKPRKGEQKYTWTEYLLRQQSPIPIAEGVTDVIDAMTEKGLSKPQAKQILEGIFIATVVGGTGLKIKDMPEKKEKENLDIYSLKEPEVKIDLDNGLDKNIMSEYVKYNRRLNLLDKQVSSILDDPKNTPETITKKLNQAKLTNDYRYYLNNSTQLDKFENVLTYFSKLDRKEQVKYKGVIEGAAKDILKAKKQNTDIELSEEIMNLYELYQESISSRKEKKQNLKEGLE
jgi:hypothetical protein